MSRSMMKMKRQLQIKQQFKFNEWNYDEEFKDSFNIAKYKT